MKNAIGDTAEVLGGLLAPAVIEIAGFFKSAAEGASDFIRSITETPLDTTIRQLEELGDVSQTLLRLKGIQLDREIKKLNAELLISNKTGLDAEQIEKRLTAMPGERIALVKEISDINENTTEEYRKQIKMQIDSNALSLGGLSYLNDTKLQLAMMKDFSEKKLGLEELTGVAQERRLRALDAEEIRLAEVANLVAQILVLESQRIDLATSDFLEQSPIDPEYVEFTMLLTDAQIKYNKSLDDEAEKIKLIKKLRRNATFDAIGDTLKFAETLAKTKEAQKNLAFAQAMVSAIQTGLNTFETVSKFAPPPFPLIAALAAGGAATGMALKVRQFEQGGLIGGQRHSQGGTMIEAERGEFIMSRNAVESIGVSNLQAMNAGGGAVNINISGNVMTSDFVEGELADKITEAVRKGVDFGIS